ncbi:acyltransferase family protein [Iamia majanohamensis]|uniref:Acyltransferase family protein n=1 Tax=Iamia majanohamensis TaxID=467976 RepID=A0AAF0BVY7_9ACTN|nr:acyltransferase family protein [Iamia majanohamensis]WCO67463.1 acyltransferase family protein [Iamia majanohamensis]
MRRRAAPGDSAPHPDAPGRGGAADDGAATAGWTEHFGYRPGLDGLRALALLAIFVVHADVGMASGGFLAVSTFFTLSGFLITSLLLGERARRGRVDLRAFWVRRARRLLPASMVAIAGIVVATIAIGDAVQVGRIRADAASALAYVANWRFILVGDEYGARFESESPLLHFWSLAIEEQFYLVFPLVMVGALALLRRWRWAVVAVLGGLLVASQLQSVLLSRHASVDRMYFGTDVRASELLVGALVAWVWTTQRARVARVVVGPLRWLGPALLVVMGLLISTAEADDLIWYRGGLVLYAVITCVVVLAAIQPHGLLPRALSWTPLVWIGVTSYGAYLVHWPIFVWLRSETAMGGGARLLVGTLASLSLASLSYLLVEQPVRVAPRLPRPALVAVPVLLVVISLGAVAVVPEDPANAREVALADRGALLAEEIEEGPADGSRPTVAMFGDSSALSTALGLATWDGQPGATLAATEGWTKLGCSVLSPVTLDNGGGTIRTPSTCDGLVGKVQRAAQASQPDVAVVQFGPWEVSEIRLEDDGPFRTLGDPVLDAAVQDRLEETAAALLEVSPHVALLTSPRLDPGARDGRSPTEPRDEADPARIARFNELVREAAEIDPRVEVVDFGAYLDARPDLPSLRPDGVHLSWDGAIDASSWLGPALTEVATEGPR